MAARRRTSKGVGDDGIDADDVLLDGNGPRGVWRDRVTERSLERAKKRSLERGQAFIDAALRLMRESQADDFTLQQVADLTNQSLRTFYSHFASKNDLFLAVFEEEVHRHAADLRRAVDKYDDPLERLAAFAVAGAETKGESSEVVALARYRLRLSESHPEDVAVVQAPTVNLARELIQDAIDANAIPASINVDHYAYLLVTIKSAYLHSKILGNELGVELPTPVELASFCMEGMKATLPAVFAKR